MSLCPLCRSMEESVNHVFWECTFIKCVLEGAGIDGLFSSMEQNWDKWIANLFLSMQKEQCKRLVITFWAVWHHRNEVYHQGEKQCATRLISFIKAFYTKNNQLKLVSKTGVRQNEGAWTPPRTNMAKGNFDATYNSHMMSSVSRIIFRDFEGYILVACTYPNTFVIDATTAEAKAYLQTVTVAEELGFRNLVIEGDSLTVIKKSKHLKRINQILV
ncbi:hypothetical protein J1N35_001187 [Gossypium stocksii]|uniref:RNase H type-1 domain-containing protein n=1 Tax=Gossypium stocksii TaxID=47602 RepID=A0A9D3WJH7_9ROSI|nr:hypothetical protein J1N35_001187 [Gossypium stocksii]